MNDFYSLMEEQRKLDGKVVALFERMHEDFKELKQEKVPITTTKAFKTVTAFAATCCRSLAVDCDIECPFSDKQCRNIKAEDWEHYILTSDE